MLMQGSSQEGVTGRTAQATLVTSDTHLESSQNNLGVTLRSISAVHVQVEDLPFATVVFKYLQDKHDGSHNLQCLTEVQMKLLLVCSSVYLRRQMETSKQWWRWKYHTPHHAASNGNTHLAS